MCISGNLFYLKNKTRTTLDWCIIETKLYLQPQDHNGFGSNSRLPMALYKSCMPSWIANVELQMANLTYAASHLVANGEISKFSFLTPVFTRPSDVCIGLRLQQVMKSQWQSKSLERSKPLKKLSLKHKLSSSKEKHKFTNSLMAVSKYKWGF